MNSQKNEAMNKSIMRYVPKEKTYCQSMALTSRINMAISIDSLGHSTYYERLFQAMKFTPTQLLFSGLWRMWRKKEYGRVYSVSQTVKTRHRIHQRENMIIGIKKMEKDAEDGMAYLSGICLEDAQEDNDGNCDEADRKRERTTTNKNKRTSLTSRKKEEECNCGGRDHQRITSSKCP
jgi:hypothetical protein